jgi:hypothetical protein
MSPPENTPNTMQTPAPSKEELREDENYTPRPPRPFTPRSGSGKLARYKHDRYLANRDRILGDLHAESMKSPKKERTPAWKAKSHKRRSTAAKRHWKKMPAAKRQNALRALDAGRAVQAAEYAEQRRPWEIIKRRLGGEEYNTLVKLFGPKPVQYCLRGADIPKGKLCLYDRARPFTRGSGTALQKSLGFTKAEFAQRIAIRERRVAIWLTKPDNHLERSEAIKCADLRDKVAKKLLSDDRIRGLSHLDSYSRANVLFTVFPNLKSEYKLLLEIIPEVRAFLKGRESACEEEQLGNFVFDGAQRETRGELSGHDFRVLLRWLPQLAKWILANQARLTASEPTRLLAFDLLATTCFCSPKIVKAAISNTADPYGAQRMRELIRQHVTITPTSAQIAIAASGTAPLPSKPRKKYQHEPSWKSKASLFRAQVQVTLPTFREALRELRQTKRAAPLNPTAWRDALRQKKHSDAEIDAVLGSKTSEAAAIRCAAVRRGLKLKTAQNLYYSGSPKTKSPKK